MGKAENKMEKYHLLQKQSLPLKVKIKMSKARIREALIKHKCYISFSGGKDSMVLMHLVKSIDSSVPVVFCDTGVEWPSVKRMGKQWADVILKPKLPFKTIVDKYGYPAISKDNAKKIHEYRNTKSKNMIERTLYGNAKGNGKLPDKWRFLLDGPFNISHKCCHILKKNPATKYEKESGRIPFIGTLAEDGKLRQMAYLKGGCNRFNAKRPVSTPLGFWLRQDIDKYLLKNKLPIADIYKYVDHTGCVFCLFACTRKDWNKLKLIKDKFPKIFLACQKLGMIDIYNYIMENTRKVKNKI